MSLPPNEYQFDFSQPFTISDYAAYDRWQKSPNDMERTIEFYEVVDKFFAGDLFALDMNEVTQVIVQFAEKLVAHLGAKQ